MSKKVIAQGKYLRLINDNHWEFVERSRGSGVVVIVASIENRLILTEQYRASLAKIIIELPAGLVGDTPGDEEESLETAAKRELLEETGYEAQRMTFLSFGPPSAGLSNEVVTHFLAEELEKVGPGGGDENENIIVHEIPMHQVEAFAAEKLKEGALIDPKIFAGLYFALRHRLIERKP